MSLDPIFHLCRRIASLLTVPQQQSQKRMLLDQDFISPDLESPLVAVKKNISFHILPFVPPLKIILYLVAFLACSPVTTAHGAVTYNFGDTNVFEQPFMRGGFTCGILPATEENESELAAACFASSWRYYGNPIWECADDEVRFQGVDRIENNRIYVSIWRKFPVQYSGYCTYATRTYKDFYIGYTATCPSGIKVTGDAATLMSGCYNSCSVNKLSPTESDTWVSTLQGTTTGKTCSSLPSSVNTGKMLACGTAGSSVFEVKPKTNNPINFAIGNKFFRETDYRGSGSFPIVFGRTYNSLDLGWRFAYTQRIESLAANKMAVRRPGGQTYEFTLNGIAWTPDPDVVERLEWQPEAYGGAGGWRYTLADHTRELYDANGRLIAIRNPAGLEQTVGYSMDGKEMTVTNPEGDTLQIVLNDTGLLPLSITDKTGRTSSYTFDGLYLRQVSYPNGTTKQYVYEVPERPWLITGIIDENGYRSHTVAYDAQGRAIMSELAGGAERVEVSYNDDGTTTLTNALGKRTRFHFQTIHGVKKIVHVDGEPTATCQGTAMDYAFDDNGFLTEKTDAEGVTTRFGRDAHGLELTRTEAAGLPEERTVTTEWDVERRLPLRRIEAGRVMTYTYDAQGRLLSRTTTAVAE